MVWQGQESVEGCLVSTLVFPSRAPSRAPSLPLAEEVVVAVGRGSGTGQFRRSQTKQVGRNLRDCEMDK